MAELQIYLFDQQKELNNEQICHTVQVLLDIDKKQSDIIIENFEKIQDILDECQEMISQNNAEDVAKLDLNEFYDNYQSVSNQNTN